jgi:hypothetical protein
LWALYAIILLIVLIVGILSVPVDLTFKLQTSEFHKRRFQLSCFWGLLRFDLYKPVKNGKAVVSRKPALKKKRLGAGTIFDILLVRGLFPSFLKLIRRVFRYSRLRHLKVDIVIGPEDPANFGYLYAFLVPVNYWLGKTPHHIVINPVFEGQLILEGAAEGEFRTYPILLLGSALAFTFSRPGIEVLRILRKQWK